MLETLIRLQEKAADLAPKAAALSPLEASDAEDAIIGWLDDRAVADGWDMAPAFMAAGLDGSWLDDVAAWTVLAGLLVVGAGFNGASFLDFNDNISSLIMALLAFGSIACYAAALSLTGRPADLR